MPKPTTTDLEMQSAAKVVRVPTSNFHCPFDDHMMSVEIPAGQRLIDTIWTCPKCGRKYKTPAIETLMIEGPVDA
jgi:ribosomal protein L37AE/L43A